MSKKLIFDNIDIEKRKFHYSKHLIDIKNVNVHKIMTLNKVLNSLLITSMTIKLNHCVQCFQKWVSMEKVWLKHLFFD